MVEVETMFVDMTLAELKQAAGDLIEGIDAVGSELSSVELLGEARALAASAIALADHHKICLAALATREAQIELVREAMRRKP
jgi:hypothetical protein